jgi:hypothetical protein
VDITSPKELPAKQRKVLSWLKKAAKLSLLDLAIRKCLSKKTSRDVEKILERGTHVIPPKTSSAPVIGPVRLGEVAAMKVEEVIARLEKHEAECNLRYKSIEQRLADHKTSLKSLDTKLWGLAVLIIIAPFVQKFLG